MLAAFERASDAVAAALDAQRALLAELGDVFRVRMAVHTDEVLVRNERNYAGPALNRAARLRACGHGGQILVSGTTADLVGRSSAGRRLVDPARAPPPPRPRTGRRRCGSWRRPICRRSSRRSSLSTPSPPTCRSGSRPSSGGSQELEELGPLVTDPSVRLITLTGPGRSRQDPPRLAGGAGQRGGVRRRGVVGGAGAGHRRRPSGGHDRQSDGPARGARRLAPRPGPDLPRRQACPGRDGQLRAPGRGVRRRSPTSCCAACPGVTVLATSREPLGIGRRDGLAGPVAVVARRVRAASPRRAGRLRRRAAVRRAGAARPGRTSSCRRPTSARCRRSAGASTASPWPSSWPRRVSGSLPVERVAAELHERFRLLTGGARTALPRQQTLLASVDWSHDLLSDDERIAAAPAGGVRRHLHRRGG